MRRCFRSSELEKSWPKAISSLLCLIRSPRCLISRPSVFSIRLWKVSRITKRRIRTGLIDKRWELIRKWFRSRLGRLFRWIFSSRLLTRFLFRFLWNTFRVWGLSTWPTMTSKRLVFWMAAKVLSRLIYREIWLEIWRTNLMSQSLKFWFWMKILWKQLKGFLRQNSFNFCL